MTLSKEIANALLSIKAIRFSLDTPVIFKMGIVSPVYIDNRILPFYPTRWSTIFQGFEHLIEDDVLSFDIIAGVEAAGIPHSAALGFELKRPSIFVRKQLKDHGTKKLVEGGDVTGRRVLLIEDHVSTGSSSLSAVESIRKAGGVVTDCLSITSYEWKEASDNFKQHKVKLHTLTSFKDIFEQAVAMKLIDASGVKEVRSWIRDPELWSKRNS